MGFDNECILNIQSLPGEYFCPVCRTLVYPNEALQSQCTHLYCKTCLAYVVATTKACPYDGYLVTETDSKPLVESNKPLAETIGKVMVHCLYNKSGCQWQGTLSACITHGSTCGYGNSPVVCNRCGARIVHRQVQEHAQLCSGLQSQTQPSTATAQTVTKDPSRVSSAASAAAAATTVPLATAVTTVTASSVATGGLVDATTATMVAAPPSFAGASTVPQASTAEQWYQQQYSQYYQQQYPGYNPYAQHYQQYGQYPQAYQQYTQPQMQVASQNAVPASAQPAQVMQSSQPQPMLQSQSQQPTQIQASTGYPQAQLHQVQPQPQIQPNLQTPAGQTQPQQLVQSAYQVPPAQQQSQVPLQLPAPQAQPTVHQSSSTRGGYQQFAVPSSQATTHQIQPNVQTQDPQQQHAQFPALSQQQNLQPQLQINTQIQHQSPQVQQQSYPQSQVYPLPVPHLHPQNTSYPQQQMPPGAPVQQLVHTSHQGLVSQHPAPMRPPLPGQQLAMLPLQGIQHTPQHQHAGYHAQRPPIQSSVPSQAPQGLPPHSTIPSQAGQSYQQGLPSMHHQVHSRPSQPYVPPHTQQHVPGYGYAGQHTQTSASRLMNPAAPPQQFQPQSSGPVNNLQASVMNQQPSMLRTVNTGGRPTVQGSENASGAAHNNSITENRTNGAESSVLKPTMSQSLSADNMNGENNDFGSGSKDVRAGEALDSAGKDRIAGQAGNSRPPGLQGGKMYKASDAYNNPEQGGSVQQASQKNAGPPGAYPGMGPQNPFGQDRMLPQNIVNSGPMPYNMQGQPNQIKPPKHSVAQKFCPPMQQPYGLFHSGMVQRTFGENQIQSPMPHPAGIRPADGMVQPPIGGPFPGHHDTMPPFVPDPLVRPHPAGTLNINGVGGGPFVSGRAFHEEGFNTSREHLRSFGVHPGRHHGNHNDIEDPKQFPGPAHLEIGSNSFERTLGTHDGFFDRPAFANQKGPFPIAFNEESSRMPNATSAHPDFLSPSAEFDHGTDGMPNLRNPDPFVQGMSHGPGPGGIHNDYFGSVNLPGNAQHAFDGPVFPRFHPGHMHPNDRNLVDDHSFHGFPKEPGRFGLGGLVRDVGASWCRICMFNCGSTENLDLHVQTREHQQCAMDLVLKMKQDVAKRQKLNYGGPKSFHNKKITGKGHFRGNKR